MGNPFSWAGRVAILTGASSGIGRATTLELARRGVHVVAIARREDRLAETVAAAPPDAAPILPLVGDVADPELPSRAVELALSRFGRLDVLVNNAGVSKRKHILDVTPADVERTIEVNLTGAIRFVLAALPPMVERGEGWIVNVSSVAGRIPNPRESVYCASKYGLSGFSDALHFDLATRGIHTLLVHPGPIATEIWDTLETPPAYAGRMVPAEAVSEAILEAIRRRRHEITVPRHLGFVALLKALCPSILRFGMARFDPDRRGDGATP